MIQVSRSHFYKRLLIMFVGFFSPHPFGGRGVSLRFFVFFNFFLYFFLPWISAVFIKNWTPHLMIILVRRQPVMYTAHNNHLLSSRFFIQWHQVSRQQFYTTAVISGCTLHNLVIIHSQINDKRTRRVSNK